MTLFQDISSKKKEEISFFIGKIVDFSMNAHFFRIMLHKKDFANLRLLRKL